MFHCTANLQRILFQTCINIYTFERNLKNYADKNIYDRHTFLFFFFLSIFFLKLYRLIAIVTKFSSIKKKKITSSTHPDISVNVSFFFSFQLFHPIINFSLNFIDRIFDDRNHYKIFLYQEKKNHNLTSSFIPVNASFSFSFQLFHRIVNFSLNFIDQSQSLQNFHLSRKKKITTSIYPLFHPRKRFFFFFFSIIPSYHKFFLKLYRSIEFSTIAIVIQIFLYQEKKKSQPRLYRSNFRRSLQNFPLSRKKKITTSTHSLLHPRKRSFLERTSRASHVRA